MVLAHGEDLNVFYNDQLIVVLVEDGAIDDAIEVFLVALCEKQHCLCIALRGLQKSFSVGVFSNALQNGSHSLGQLSQVSGLPQLIGLGLDQGIVVRRAGFGGCCVSRCVCGLVAFRIQAIDKFSSDRGPLGSSLLG
jgi:hypothetical protein